MAETFKNQVDALTGFASTEDDALSDWLTAGAREIFTILPPLIKERCIASTTIDASPNSLEELDTIGEIVSVSRKHADSDGVFHPCRKVPVWAHSRVTDSTDLMYATVTDPAYYIFNNSLRVFPTTTDNQTAHIHYYPIPTVTHGVATINDFPDEAEYLVALYAAAKGLHRLMNEHSSNWPSEVDSITFDSMTTSLPTYTNPNSFVPSSSPEVPSFTYTDVSVSDIVKPIIELADKAALTASAPVYNAPAFLPPEFPALPDVPIPPAIRDLNLDISSVTAPAYNPPTVALDFADAENWIKVEEDNEMLTSRTTLMGSQVSLFQAEMTNELNDYNDKKAIWEKDIDVLTKNIDLDNQEDTMLLDRYKIEVSKYQVQINNKINEYNAKFSNGMQDYTAKIQVELNKYNERVVVYNEDMTRKTENFQKDINIASANVQNELANNSKNLEKNTQVGLQNALSNYKKGVEEYSAKLQKYQSEVGTEVQRFTQDLSKNTSEFGSNLQKYSAEYQKVSIDNQNKLAKYAQDLSNYGTKIQKHTADYQWYQSQYAQLKQDYNQGITMLVGGATPQPSKQEGE